MKGDRVRDYFKDILEEYVFDQFTDEFLQKLSVSEIMIGVPIPINIKNFGDFKSGGIRTIDIVKSVAIVLGCDPSFRYRDNYVAFLEKIFQGKVEEILINEGYSTMSAGNALKAAAYFRAALTVHPQSMHAIYGYALACRTLYLSGGDEAFVGGFKAESIEAFELLNEFYPDFAFAYYYLGYAYLNMGLYVKAKLMWEKFIEVFDQDQYISGGTEEKAEIKERLKQLEAPVEIELAINEIVSGKYTKGMKTLEQYQASEYKDWWPLHYYLGIAYECTGMTEQAIAAFKNVLLLYPSHIDSMDELVAIYHMLGDSENEKKYLQKIQMIKAAHTNL